jgi:hypothetical protein
LFAHAGLILGRSFFQMIDDDGFDGHFALLQLES